MKLFFLIAIVLALVSSTMSCIPTQPPTLAPMPEPTPTPTPETSPRPEPVLRPVPTTPQPATTPGPPPAPSPTPTPTPRPTPVTPTVVIPNTTAEVTKDVEYGRAGDIPLLLDIYTPETPIVTPMPAVIWMHGGSWKYLDKSNNHMLRSVKTLARHGFFAVSINYRLSGVAPFPAAVEDSKCAVRWLRANAEKYNVDPNRIGAWGSSSGGHLAMMLGCADETAGLEGNGGWGEFSSRVQAVCSYYGPTDLVSTYRKIKERQGSVPDSHHYVQFLGGHLEEKPDMWKAASPINHVTADDPPLLLVHGELDSVVPLIVSGKMYKTYQQAGLETSLIRVSDADHLFKQIADRHISPSMEEIEQIVLDFFVKHLLITR